MTAPTPGPPTVTSEAADRLAVTIHELRPDWDRPGIRSALRKVADRPLGVVIIAATTAAMTRTDQRSPAVIAMTGAHWPTLNGAQPGLVTYCEHGRPGALHCPDCKPAGQRVGPSPEQREVIRAALREGRAATSQFGNPDVVATQNARLADEHRHDFTPKRNRRPMHGTRLHPSATAEAPPLADLADTLPPVKETR